MDRRLALMRLLNPVAGRAPRLFYRIAPVVGRVAWTIRPGMRRTIVRNLLPLCGGDEVRARRHGVEVIQNVARYYVDIASLPYRAMESFERDHLQIVNGERLDILKRAGPAIIVSSHNGNPELALQALTFRGRPFVALVEELEPPAFSAYMLRIRSSAGGTFRVANLGGLRDCYEALLAGGLVAMVADRDLQRNGVPVQLFGRRVCIGRGPWELARRTGSVILPMFAVRTTFENMLVTVEEPFYVARTADAGADIAAAAQHWATLLEAFLPRCPGQWTVLEDFWKVHACDES